MKKNVLEEAEIGGCREVHAPLPLVDDDALEAVVGVGGGGGASRCCCCFGGGEGEEKKRVSKKRGERLKECFVSFRSYLFFEK